MADIPLPKTPLDYLQITDTNYNEYIALIESHITEAERLIAETRRNGISHIHNIGKYKDIGNYRNTISQDKAWLTRSYQGIARSIQDIKFKQIKHDNPLIDSKKMRMFEIILKLYNYIKQAFENQLNWLNGQYDINNNPQIKFIDFRALESQWITNLKQALKEAQNYRELVFEQSKLPTDAPRLPPPRPDITPTSVATAIALDIEPANVASSRASSRAHGMLERSAARSASRSQRPSSGGMATRKKIYRKRNKTKHYKRQIKRYTKKYRIHY